MLKLAPGWKGKTAETDTQLASFHPLSMEDFKAAPDSDVYFLQSIKGHLNRVHVVSKNKIAVTNPTPEDSRCESCHKKGWLAKEFRTSKVDSATEPVWVCPDCAQPAQGEPMKTLDDVESERPPTNLRVLKEHPKLMDLMLQTYQPAIREIRQTGSMSPFVFIETAASHKMVQSFKTPRLEIGFEDARKAILAAPPNAVRYAFAYLGYITHDGVRYEGIFVGGGERGDPEGALMGMKYKQRLPEVKFDAIDGPRLMPSNENLFALAADPDAASRIAPVYTRLVADMAHNHGPGHDEALKYEIRKCGAVHLDLGDLDRPFRKELQKGPDTVHVVLGRKSWVTFFGPEAKEVILARDTLLPVGDAGVFPAFNEDGLITIGYSPPKSMLKKDGPKEVPIIVLWITMFKVIDKDADGKI
jgi:hypothetical protein